MPELESRSSQTKEGLVADARRELINFRLRGGSTENFTAVSKLLALAETFIRGISESVNVPIKTSRDEDEGARWVSIKKVSYSRGNPNPGYHSESYVRKLKEQGRIPFKNTSPGRYLVDEKKVPKKPKNMPGSLSKNGSANAR
jgi:hypothetical protein